MNGGLSVGMCCDWLSALSKCFPRRGLTNLERLVMKYEAEWKGFDRGREGLMGSETWLETLRILGDHEGVSINQYDAPLYQDLERKLPDVSWLDESRERSFFRDYQMLWTLSGVLIPTIETGGIIRLSDLGHDLLKERLSQNAVWVQAMATHEEELVHNSETISERPFAVLAECFLALGERAISIRELYFGVMMGWRPGDGDLQSSLSEVPQDSEMQATRRRRLRAMIKKMVQVGAVQEAGRDYWTARSIDILQPIAEGTTLIEPEIPEPTPDEHLEDATEKELETFANELDTLPTESRERVLRAIAARRGQPKFRRRLLKLYQGRCALTQWDAEKALEAAHIVPWSDDGEDSPRNGMLLRADIHTLFDLHYLSVDPAEWKVYVADLIAHTRYGELQGQKVTLPLSKADWPASDHLHMHFARAQS